MADSVLVDKGAIGILTRILAEKALRLESYQLLDKSVIAAVQTVVGSRLESVAYWCLNKEMTAQLLAEPEFYCGGEIELFFSGARSLFITWDENAGWPDGFSLRAGTVTAFKSGFLEKWHGSELPTWAPVIRKNLKAVTVFGLNSTPHLLRLEFDSGGEVFIGDGHETTFGDGDDVLVRSGANGPDLTQFEVLARIGSSGKDVHRKCSQ